MQEDTPTSRSFPDVGPIHLETLDTEVVGFELPKVKAVGRMGESTGVFFQYDRHFNWLQRTMIRLLLGIDIENL